MTDNTIVGSIGSCQGASVYSVGDHLYESCVFRGNRATWPSALGGGLYSVVGHLRLDGCLFRENTAGNGLARGGALSIANGSFEIVSSIFACNTITGGSVVTGGGIYAGNSDGSLVNSTLVWNEPSAIHATGPSDVDIRNSIVFFNNGGANQFDGPGTIAATYCDVQLGAPFLHGSDSRLFTGEGGCQTAKLLARS